MAMFRAERFDLGEARISMRPIASCEQRGQPRDGDGRRPFDESTSVVGQPAGVWYRRAVSFARDLRAEEVDRRLRAMEALLDEPSDPLAEDLDALRDCLGDERKRVQRQAAECLAALGGRVGGVEELLLGCLTSASPRFRWGAAYALARMGSFPEEALDVLVVALGSADNDLRWAAADLLARAAVSRRRETVGRLVAACRADSAEVRKMALYCLRDIGPGSEDGLRVVAGLLSDGDHGVRLAALSAVARLAPDPISAARLLLPRLADPDRRVRRAAAATLGRIGDRSPDVLAELRHACESDDPSLCRAADQALRTLGGTGT
jgi:HEAT repeat protein